MDEAKRELVAGWLAKAKHDLDSARKLAAGDEPIFDTAFTIASKPQKNRSKAIWFIATSHSTKPTILMCW